MIVRMKTVRVRTGPAVVVPSIGITHAVLRNTVLLSAVTRIINRLTEDRAALRSRDIADPAVLRHAERIADLTDGVMTIAIIDLPIVPRADRRSMDIADPEDLRRAVTIAGLTGDEVTTATTTLRIEDRAVARSTDSVVPVDRHHAEAVAISDGRKAWITVVVLRLTFQRVRRSPSVPELAGMAVVS